MRVRPWMSPDPVTVEPTVDVVPARLMPARRISALSVPEEGALAGMPTSAHRLRSLLTPLPAPHGGARDAQPAAS